MLYRRGDFAIIRKSISFALMENGVRSRLSKGNSCFTGAGFCFHAKVDKLRFDGKWSAIKVVEGESRALPVRGLFSFESR